MKIQLPAQVNIMITENSDYPSLTKEIIKIVQPEDFEREIRDFQDRPIIIDFWAEWCGPCKRFFPVFEEAHKSEFGRKFIFTKLNTEDPAGVIADALGVTGIPTILILYKNKEIHRIVGAVRKGQFFDQLRDISERFNL